MEERLLLELTTELKEADENFSAELLRAKINNAIREVKLARRYPKWYTDEQIDDDLEYYVSQIKNLALYDYSKVGAEGEQSHNENEYTRVYESRNSIFKGIIPFARM